MRNIMNLVNLSLNNFLSIKKMALFIVVAFGAASLVNPGFSSMLVGMITYVIAYQTMAYEDSYGIDHMIAHLPVTKNEYVISRYIFGIITIVGAGILCSLIFFISKKMNLVDLTGIDYKIILYMGIISAVVLISILIPVLLYFGMKKGRMAIILIFMVIVMIPSLVINDIETAMNILNKLMRNIMNLVNLSFNNFLSIKKMALFIVVAFGAASLVNPGFSSMLVGMITYVIAYQTMAYEDSYGIDYMIAHLPVTRNEYVISRYIFGIITIVGSGILCSLIFFISKKMNLVDLTGIDYKMILYIGIISAVVLISILIPVLLYFGMKKGRMAIIFIFMVIVMIPSLVINDIETAMNILNKLSEMNINLLSGVLTIVILLISYFITRFLYEKKEII